MGEHIGASPEVSYYEHDFYTGYVGSVPILIGDGSIVKLSIGIKANHEDGAYIPGAGLIYLNPSNVTREGFYPNSTVHHEFTHFLWDNIHPALKQSIMEYFTGDPTTLSYLSRFVEAICSGYRGMFYINLFSSTNSDPRQFQFADGKIYTFSLDAVINELLAHANSQRQFPELANLALTAIAQLSEERQQFLEKMGLVGGRLYEPQIPMIVAAVNAVLAQIQA